MINIEIGDNLAFTLLMVSLAFSLAWIWRKPRP